MPTATTHRFPALASALTEPGSFSWSNVNNVKADDGSVTSTAGLSDAATVWLKAQSFGHGADLDGTETITGIEVEIERAQTSTQLYDYSVRISGGTAGLSNGFYDNSWTSANWTAGNGSIITYGGSGYLWGRTWTASEVTGVLFSTLVSVTGQAPNFTGPQIDYITTSIWYESAEGGNKYEIRFGDKVIEEVRFGSTLIEEARFGNNLIK